MRALDRDESVVGKLHVVPGGRRGTDDDLPERSWDGILERAFSEARTPMRQDLPPLDDRLRNPYGLPPGDCPHRRAGMRLTTLPGRFAVCRLAADAALPSWAIGSLVSITRTNRELSVVCAADGVPDGVRVESGWRAIEIGGPLSLEMVGVIASVAAPLARAGIPVFVISTYDTDYLLVKDERLESAKVVLVDGGHLVDGRSSG